MHTKDFLRRAWRGSCPQCGARTLFERYARLRRECPECGLIFRREQGSMTGSMYLSAIVTELFAGALVLFIFFTFDWGLATSLAVGIPVLLLFSYWWLPRSIALWTAIEYATDVNNRESWAKPRP